jgi:hypothetical protein
MAVIAEFNATISAGGIRELLQQGTKTRRFLCRAGSLSPWLQLHGPCGYPINPARDLGARLAHAVLAIAGKGKSDWGYTWIPVIAPLIGGIIGADRSTIVGF